MSSSRAAQRAAPANPAPQRRRAIPRAILTKGAPRYNTRSCSWAHAACALRRARSSAPRDTERRRSTAGLYAGRVPLTLDAKRTRGQGRRSRPLLGAPPCIPAPYCVARLYSLPPGPHGIVALSARRSSVCSLTEVAIWRLALLGPPCSFLHARRPPPPLSAPCSRPSLVSRASEGALAEEATVCTRLAVAPAVVPSSLALLPPILPPFKVFLPVDAPLCPLCAWAFVVLSVRVVIP